MTVKREWKYEGTELAWLHDRLGRSDDGPGHVVSELVPEGYEAYVRIFHRFRATDGSGRTRRWKAWAKDSGVPFHPEMSHRWLRSDEPDPGPRWMADEGTLDERSRGALARLLAAVSGEQDVYFAYDLGALLWGAHDEPLVRHGSLAHLEDVRASLTDVLGDSGPEFWWPQDRSWVVTTDYDLLSTYVGCSSRTAERILTDDTLEALPVTPHTRVDWDTEPPQGEQPPHIQQTTTKGPAPGGAAPF
ncbi:hypothetical protein ABZ819_22510 [Streptomyces venezuelae]|uniref:hypothetical protein n=1 Tax=Streptomyces venezuelae TaxID=54571 RepID=UPI00342B2734